MLVHGMFYLLKVNNQQAEKKAKKKKTQQNKIILITHRKCSQNTVSEYYAYISFFI